MVMIRCPRCAKDLPDESLFCRRCGCALSRQAGGWRAPVAPPVRPTGWGDERPAFAGGREVKPAPARPAVVAKKTSGGGGGVVVVLAIVAGVWFVNARVQVKTATPTPALTPLPDVAAEMRRINERMAAPPSNPLATPSAMDPRNTVGNPWEPPRPVHVVPGPMRLGPYDPAWQQRHALDAATAELKTAKARAAKQVGAQIHRVEPVEPDDE